MLQLETDLRTLCYCGKDHIETNHGLAKRKKELSQLKLTWKVNLNQKIQLWKTIWNQKICLENKMLQLE